MTWVNANVFTGVCVGGPLDGKIATHGSPVFKTLIEPPKVSFDYTSGHLPCDDVVHVGVYRYDGKRWQYVEGAE